MQTIKVLNNTNPHRAESRRAKAFNACVTAKTVEEYKASPFAKPKYLLRWQAMGLIKLEGEAPVKTVPAAKVPAAKVPAAKVPAAKVPAAKVPTKPTGIAAKLAKAEKAVKA